MVTPSLFVKARFGFVALPQPPLGRRRPVDKFPLGGDWELADSGQFTIIDTSTPAHFKTPHG
jgi:hypothetical protein